jgi:glycine hydroxymethyltransferase
MKAELLYFLKCFEKAENKNCSSINLVPSENRLSPLASRVLSSDFYNRYFFNDQLRSDFWEFRGGQEIGHVERDFIIPALQRLSGAEFVNIRSISGMNAMALVISAFGGQLGNTVVSISSSSGGHFATQSLIARLGYKSKAIHISEGIVDKSELEQILISDTVSLVYVDLQNSLDVLDVGAFAEVIKVCSPSTLLHIDASHTLGLILGKTIPNPLICGANSFGGSTHKTFPGPQKGVIFCNCSNLFQALQEAQFDMVSSHHFAETIALGIAALEFEYFGSAYASQVVSNAKTLSYELAKLGFNVSGKPPNFTNTHQVWLQADNSILTDEIAQRLFSQGIRVNLQSDLPGLVGKSFRLGTNEVTFEGATEESMVLIAKAFAAAREDRADVIENWSAVVRSSFKPPFYFVDLE